MPLLRLSYTMIAIAMLLSVFVTDTLAGQRVALVIGNSAYQHQPLQNPRNDAQDMSRVLTDVGFEVTLKQDLDLAGMDQAIHDFTTRLGAQRGVGLFYYAGHGVEVNGESYLIPLGNQIKDSVEARYKALPLGQLQGKMRDSGAEVSLIIVDACRNNPFARGFRGSLTNRGLGRSNSQPGSLVASSTASGEVASDGLYGRNSPYTKHLLEQIRVSGQSIHEMFIQVRKGVLEETRNKQQPWEANRLTKNFYFVPPDGDTPAVGVSPTPAVDPTQVVLAIRATPSDAQVRLMNSVRDYRSGMQLPPGSYDIEVSQEGYRTHRKEYELEAGEQVIGVELETEAEAKRKEEALRAEVEALSAVLGRPLSADAADENGWTDLHYAAALNWPELVRMLLDTGARIDVQILSDSEPISDGLRQNLHKLKLADLDWKWYKDGETPLQMAAYFNARESVKLLLDRGADIHAKSDGGDTPLYYAAGEDNLETAHLLLERGADIHAKNKNGDTPLHFAAYYDALETARLLLDRGADIHAKANDGDTPLYYAAGEDNLETARLLLDRGADIHAKANDGDTPLHEAAYYDALETARLLLERGADIHAKANDGDTPLHEAAYYDALETARLLLDRGADIHAKANDGDTPLHWAAWKNSLETARLLLERGADIHAKANDGDTPLHWAAWKNSLETADLLLERGADIHAKNKYDEMTPLHFAAWKNSLETADLLLERGADIHAKDNDGDTPLHKAAWKNSLETARLLLDRGADIHAKDNDGDTPLHFAAWKNSLETARLLLERGADIHAKNKNGYTPLHWAAFDDALETARLLLERGADIHAKNKYDEMTPLHEAAWKNSLETADLLLERGADIHAKDHNDDTPLHEAAFGDALETARLLLERGADIHAKNKNGYTPLDLAKSSGNQALIELLN